MNRQNLKTQLQYVTNKTMLIAVFSFVCMIYHFAKPIICICNLKTFGGKEHVFFYICTAPSTRRIRHWL